MYSNETSPGGSDHYNNGYGYGYNNGGGSSFFFLFFLILPLLILFCCIWGCFRHRRGVTYFPGYFSRFGGGSGWGAPNVINTPEYSTYGAGIPNYSGQQSTFSTSESQLAQPNYPQNAHIREGVGNVR